MNPFIAAIIISLRYSITKCRTDLISDRITQTQKSKLWFRNKNAIVQSKLCLPPFLKCCKKQQLVSIDNSTALLSLNEPIY